MNRVYLGLGSNVDRVKHIQLAIAAVMQLGQVKLSPVYESESIGFAGEPFYNLVAELHTQLSLTQLVDSVRATERLHGRQKNEQRFAPKTLDIDILSFNDACGEFSGVCLPRDEILENAFVLKPLADIAPEQLHPLLKLSYAELWRRYDKPQALQQIPWPPEAMG